MKTIVISPDRTFIINNFSSASSASLVSFIRHRWLVLFSFCAWLDRAEIER